MASTRREEAKLYGLHLKHSGILKHLGRTPCRVQVKMCTSANDHLGQCFKLWDACTKIYAECFVSHNRVSYMFHIYIKYLPCFLHYLVHPTQTPECLILNTLPNI